MNPRISTLAIQFNAYRPALQRRGCDSQELVIAENPWVLSKSWRDLGRWEVPPDAEDDGDYDWKQLVDADALIIRNHFLDWVQQNTPDGFTATGAIHGSEKNWLEFRITLTPKTKQATPIRNK